MPSDITFLRSWVKTLPASGMVFPDSATDQLKYFLWKIYTPLHPTVRNAAVALKLIQHRGRQNFLLGRLASTKDVKKFIDCLIGRGFGNHFVAWKDEGELASLRYVENFMYQYHIRIFEDGEVRGHYEYTPEYRPWLHLKAVRQEKRAEDFRKMIGDQVAIV